MLSLELRGAVRLGRARPLKGYYMDLIKKFEEELIQLIAKEFGGWPCLGSIISHGQNYGNKWIIFMVDNQLEIHVREKLFHDEYNPEIRKNETVYTIPLNDPECFKKLKNLTEK